jgi:hypothetical protein
MLKRRVCEYYNDLDCLNELTFSQQDILKKMVRYGHITTKSTDYIHFLKTVQPHFNEVYNGFKTFEIRKNDRDYELYDLLVLEEYPYDDRRVFGKVISILYDYEYPKGLKKGYVIMSLKDL